MFGFEVVVRADDEPAVCVGKDSHGGFDGHIRFEVGFVIGVECTAVGTRDDINFTKIVAPHRGEVTLEIRDFVLTRFVITRGGTIAADGGEDNDESEKNY